MGMKSTIHEWLKLLLIIVFLGTILIWIMSPTGVYRDVWVPKIRATADIPFFGAQGSRIMEYTFPMLFIAVVGCIYLHLGKKIEDENVKSVQWRQKEGSFAVETASSCEGSPRGCFLDRTRLCYIFVALCIWTLAVFIQVAFDKITPENAAKDGEKVWEAKLDRAALKIGLVGNLCLAFLFFPVTRGSSIMPLIGLTSESTIKYHVWLGHLSMFLFTVHGLCYIVFWASADRISEMVKWANVGVANVPGEIALVVGLAMWATTFPQIRRKTFELFFYTHYLYIIFVICFVYHAGITHTSEILPALSYNTNSIIFVNVPSISKIQWHPFTISSSSSLEPNNLSIVIKREGSWSQKLYQTLSAPLPSERLEIAVEGPYGPVC